MGTACTSFVTWRPVTAWAVGASMLLTGAAVARLAKLPKLDAEPEPVMGVAGAATPMVDCGTLPTGVAGAGSLAVGVATAANGTEFRWPVRDAVDKSSVIK